MEIFTTDLKDLQSEFDDATQTLDTLIYEQEQAERNGDAKHAAKLSREIDFWSDRVETIDHRLVTIEEARDAENNGGKPVDYLDGLLSGDSAEAEEMTADEISDLFSESTVR